MAALPAANVPFSPLFFFFSPFIVNRRRDLFFFYDSDIRRAPLFFLRTGREIDVLSLVSFPLPSHKIGWRSSPPSSPLCERIRFPSPSLHRFSFLQRVRNVSLLFNSPFLPLLSLYCPVRWQKLIFFLFLFFSLFSFSFHHEPLTAPSFSPPIRSRSLFSFPGQRFVTACASTSLFSFFLFFLSFFPNYGQQTFTLFSYHVK